MGKNRGVIASGEIPRETWYEQISGTRLYLRSPALWITQIFKLLLFILFFVTWLLGEFTASQQGGLLTRR